MVLIWRPIRSYYTLSDRPRSRSILRLCEAFVRSRSAVKPHVRAEEKLTDAQIAACFHDRTVGILWWRIWDYAEYFSRLKHSWYVSRRSLDVLSTLAV